MALRIWGAIKDRQQYFPSVSHFVKPDKHSDTDGLLALKTLCHLIETTTTGRTGLIRGKL